MGVAGGEDDEGRRKGGSHAVDCRVNLDVRISGSRLPTLIYAGGNSDGPQVLVVVDGRKGFVGPHM